MTDSYNKKLADYAKVLDGALGPHADGNYSLELVARTIPPFDAGLSRQQEDLVREKIATTLNKTGYATNKNKKKYRTAVMDEISNMTRKGYPDKVVMYYLHEVLYKIVEQPKIPEHQKNRHEFLSKFLRKAGRGEVGDSEDMEPIGSSIPIELKTDEIDKPMGLCQRLCAFLFLRRRN